MEDLVNIKDDVKIGLAGTRDLQGDLFIPPGDETVSYTHLRAHET